MTEPSREHCGATPEQAAEPDLTSEEFDAMWAEIVREHCWTIPWWLRGPEWVAYLVMWISGVPPLVAAAILDEARKRRGR